MDLRIAAHTDRAMAGAAGLLVHGRPLGHILHTEDAVFPSSAVSRKGHTTRGPTSLHESTLLSVCPGCGPVRKFWLGSGPVRIGSRFQPGT